MKRIIARFLRDESGTVVMEYGLIVTLVSIVAIASMTAIGGSVSGFFTSIVNGFSP